MSHRDRGILFLLMNAFVQREAKYILNGTCDENIMRQLWTNIHAEYLSQTRKEKQRVLQN